MGTTLNGDGEHAVKHEPSWLTRLQLPLEVLAIDKDPKLPDDYLTLPHAVGMRYSSPES